MQNCFTISRLLLSLLIFCSSTSHAALIINEVDYDQPGTDTAEFIELFNSESGVINLSGYRLDLINGQNGSAYNSINFSNIQLAANDFYVICGTAANVDNCDLDLGVGSNLIQNGAPDAIALYLNDILVDMLSYEGSVVGFVEGSGSGLVDSSLNDMMGLSLTNSTPYNINNLDFAFSCITPGEANTMQTSNCDSINTPEPAVPGLLLMGIAGLLWRSRVNGVSVYRAPGAHVS